MSKITTVICDTHITPHLPKAIFLSLVKKHGYTEILDEGHIEKLKSFERAIKVGTYIDSRPSGRMTSELHSQQQKDYEAQVKEGGLKIRQLDLDEAFLTVFDPSVSDNDKEKFEDRRNKAMAKNLHKFHVNSKTGVLAKVGVFHCHPIIKLLQNSVANIEEYLFVFAVPSVHALQQKLQKVVDHAIESTNNVLTNNEYNSLTLDELTNFGLKFAERDNLSIPECHSFKNVRFDSVCLKSWIRDGIPAAIQALTVKPSEYKSGAVAFCPFDNQDAAKECSALLGLANYLRTENDL